MLHQKPKVLVICLKTNVKKAFKKIKVSTIEKLKSTGAIDKMDYEDYEYHEDYLCYYDIPKKYFNARYNFYYKYPDYEKDDKFDIDLYTERESFRLEGIKDDPILLPIVRQAYRRDMIKPARHFRGTIRHFLALQEIFSIDRINTAQECYSKGIISKIHNIRFASEYLADTEYSRPLSPRKSDYVREIIVKNSFVFVFNRFEGNIFKDISRYVQPSDLYEVDRINFALLRMFSYSLFFLNNLIDRYDDVLEYSHFFGTKNQKHYFKSSYPGFRTL
ncbi:ORF274 (chloroplast) [Klebsormidium nitens]|uniref:ORF274 n=1 Tax=Klebsormidium nitens TaxID=105231 RepID=A0A0U9HTY3_KLENI|nr:ORF274 [Klebsormidium nitens]|eukprot:GAQ93775.1 ORF274 (chloroplast) [Klebsormidium nitens]